MIISEASHGRDCASKEKYDLDNTFEAQQVIKPGADLMPTTKRAKEEVKNLTMKDVVVMCGSIKDVGRMRLQMA